VAAGAAAVSFAADYRTEYGQWIRGHVDLNETGIHIFQFNQPAGTYPDRPNNDFVLSFTDNQSPAGVATLDFGAGSWTGPYSAGMIALAPPNVHAHYEAKAPGAGFVMSLPLRHVRNVLSRHDKTLSHDFGSLHSAPFFDPLVVGLVKRIWEERSQVDRLGNLFLESSIAALLSFLISKAQPSQLNLYKGGLAPWQKRRAVDFIRANLTKEVSLQDIADQVGLSQFHFARAFKKTVGFSPIRFQILCRVEVACRLLEETQLSVTEIALEVGYESPQSLARVFGAEMGMSPAAWRRERRR
jgi:AraC family transcriptional regulator